MVGGEVGTIPGCPSRLTVARSVMDSENNSEEELATSLPGRFVWTDEDIEIIAP